VVIDHLAGRSGRHEPLPHPLVAGDEGGLVVRGLGKSFDSHRVLADVSLTVRPRSITAVLGPSGCGKTTMLRIIAGFESADTGVVRLAGRELTGPRTWVPPQNRRIGLLPQEGALFPHLTVAGNVGFGLPPGRDRAAAVAQWLELVGLPGTANRRPEELSGGMQQRVALARALAADPALILLDEPFSSLDAGLRMTVREEIAWVLRDAGTTAVFVTHDQAEALSLADTVVLLLGGRIEQVGPPAELYHRPVTLAAAAFVGEIVELAGTARRGQVESALGVLPARIPVPDGPVTVALRPEQVAVADRRTGPTVSAQVVEHRYYGTDTVVRARLASGEVVAMRSPGYTPLPSGATVELTVRGDLLAYSGQLRAGA
jgi:iron(III) transport system ATP-binding protein